MIKVDWNYLKSPLIIFGIAILIAAGLTITGFEYEQAQEVKYQRALSALRSTHTNYRKLVNDLNLLEQYRTIYNGYKKSGLVGEEHRLSWVESLETTNQVLRLPRLAYSLEPQGEFRRPGFVERAGVSVRSSSMDLTLGLLHEEDLFALLEGLRQSIKNLFTVESCSLIRPGYSDGPLSTKSTNLEAQCRLRWMTIDAK
jgi:hypothetical protein